MQRADSFEKTLILGKIEGGRRRERQRMGWLEGITDSMDMSLSRLWELVDGQGGLACCSPWGPKELDTTEWLTWTEFSEASKFATPWLEAIFCTPGTTHIFKVAMYVSVCPLLYCSLNLTFSDFRGGAVDKNPTDNAGDMGSIPDLARFHMPCSN